MAHPYSILKQNSYRQLCNRIRSCNGEGREKSVTLTEMEVPTRSFVTSWMGLLGSASLATIKHYLVSTSKQQPQDGHRNVHNRRERESASTFTPVRGAEERVGHEPLQGVEPDDEPATVGPQHRQREDPPLVLARARGFPVRSELQDRRSELPQSSLDFGISSSSSQAALSRSQHARRGSY